MQYELEKMPVKWTGSVVARIYTGIRLMPYNMNILEKIAERRLGVRDTYL